MLRIYSLILIAPLLFSCNGSGSSSDVLAEDKDLYLPNNPDFPLISITTDNSKNITSKEDYQDAHIEVSGVGMFEDFSSTIKVRGRGNSTWLLHPKAVSSKV